MALLPVYLNVKDKPFLIRQHPFKEQTDLTIKCKESICKRQYAGVDCSGIIVSRFVR